MYVDSTCILENPLLAYRIVEGRSSTIVSSTACAAAKCLLEALEFTWNIEKRYRKIFAFRRRSG